jgi:predicted ATPase
VRFKVIPPTRSISRGIDTRFVLAQDNWNDYSFQTLYHLHLVTPESPINIGSLKILRKGQTSADYLQITEDFDALGPEFVSVGQSLDYYQHLAELGSEQRDIVLQSLRDVVKYPDMEPIFASEKGWSTSLFRDQSEDSIQEFLLLARSLLSGDYTSVPSEDLTFDFQMNGWEETLKFNFSSAGNEVEPFAYNRPPLPERIIALIGRNGSGKSTLLARLARVAHGTVVNRRSGAFQALGSISPIGIGFPRIIVVSYSAFDSFTLPGVPPLREGEPDEREQIVADSRRGIGRFIFCGLRDIASELEQQIIADATPAPDNVFASDRVSRTLLKSIDSLADEFSQTLQFIVRNNRTRDFEKVLAILSTDSSFSPWVDGAELEALLNLSAKDVFLTWSTGQKIVTQIAASLTAHTTPRSLVLIDEPEMHLHPPLLATLMNAVRYLLRKYKAFAVVATHSPVVLQETLGRHVYIIRREGATTAILRPLSETFGANVGSLTNQVFGLNSQVTDFYKVLDKLIDEFPTIDRIEGLFEPHGLSLQARAYVMSRLESKEGH